MFGVCGQGLCRQSPYIDGRRQVFDSARREFGGGYESYTVDGVIAILRMLPVFFFVIMFWAIYSQVTCLVDNSNYKIQTSASQNLSESECRH